MIHYDVLMTTLSASLYKYPCYYSPGEGTVEDQNRKKLMQKWQVSTISTPYIHTENIFQIKKVTWFYHLVTYVYWLLFFTVQRNLLGLDNIVLV